MSSDDGGDDAASAPRDIGPEARLEVLAQRVLGMHMQSCSVHPVYTRCVGEMCAATNLPADLLAYLLTYLLTYLALGRLPPSLLLHDPPLLRGRRALLCERAPLGGGAARVWEVEEDPDRRHYGRQRQGDDDHLVRTAIVSTAVVSTAIVSIVDAKETVWP